jgi:holo-[acyl-carrier protein] synthase
LRVGIDIAHLRQLRAAIAHSGERFLGRVFTAAELEHCRARGSGELASLAGRFAAKEAAIKALDLRGPFACRQVEVIALPNGAPRLRLHGEAATALARLGLSEVCVSISHDHDYAVAVVAASP